MTVTRIPVTKFKFLKIKGLVWEGKFLKFNPILLNLFQAIDSSMWASEAH